MMCVNGKTRPHPARCATFSPRAKATIGFSPRRSCHGVNDEVKSHGLMLPAAVCGHTDLQGKNLRFDAILGENFYYLKGKRSVFERSVGVQN